MRKALTALSLVLLASAPAYADSFVNGGFEDGNFGSWTAGSGYWFGGWPLDPANYQVGGPSYDASANASAIVTPGLDPLTGNALNRVYAGNYSARINDDNNNYSVSTIKQTVANYTDSTIYFEWAAVLEASHGSTDSDNFTLSLTNDTDGTTLYSVSYNSADNGSIFTYVPSTGYYYTDWQVQALDVSADIGDTFTLTLLASDCPYGGHAGYVYLDGFGSVIVPPGPTSVPEPATLAMLGLGLGALGLTRRRQVV